MTRYLKPAPTKTASVSYSLVKMGDEIAFPVISIVGSVTCFCLSPLIFTVSILFLLLLVLPLFFAGVWGSYLTNTEILATSYGRDKMYENCIKEYNKTIGDHTEQLAKPIIDKVFEHAKTKHAGGGCRYYYLDEFTDCTICQPRLKVLKELTPNMKSIDSDDDIEQAKQFLAARKEITGA